jgi:predicted transcriptional regulator
MDDQLTLRLPTALARQLDQRARAAGVKRSQLVREALAAYLSVDPAGTASRSAAAVHERIAPFLGALQLDRKAAERDELARRLRRHNWRE